MSREAKMWLGDGSDFSAAREAERALEAAGFAVGRGQRGSPRGVLLGDYDIQKWRNLRPQERRDLHGELTGDGRHGPITLWLRPNAPAEAVTAFAALSAAEPQP